jgi:hypothetical protein
VTIPTDVTLSGGANDVWIFQIAQTLTVSSAANIILSGGAQANNIFWVVAGQTTIGTTAVFNGNILDQTAIVLNTGATLNGRALAQTAVTLDSNSVIIPSGTVVTPPPAPVFTPPPTPTPVPSIPSSSAGGGYVSSVTPVTPVLTSQQQQLYSQLISIGASPSAALSAAGQIVTPTPMLPTVSIAQIQTVAANLYQGNSGTDVTILQQFLISQNKGSAAEALAQAGATSYFCVLTRAALAEFQANVGIPSLGNFGPITRAYVSAH